MSVRRQWASRLRRANMAAGQTRAILEGRLPISKSAARQAGKMGLSLLEVYHERLAEVLAEILICRAAIQAIDSDSESHRRTGIHPAIQSKLPARREQPERPSGIGDQRSLF